MSAEPDKPRLPVRKPTDLLAIVPHLLGFTPDTSLVVIGITLPAGHVQMAMRYDLPDPPDSDLAADIAAHAPSVLTSHHLTCLGLVGPARQSPRSLTRSGRLQRRLGWPYARCCASRMAATGRTCARRSPGVQAN